jgi:hypothetical protein
MKKKNQRIKMKIKRFSRALKMSNRALSHSLRECLKFNKTKYMKLKNILMLYKRGRRLQIDMQGH